MGKIFLAKWQQMFAICFTKTIKFRPQQISSILIVSFLFLPFQNCSPTQNSISTESTPDTSESNSTNSLRTGTTSSSGGTEGTTRSGQSGSYNTLNSRSGSSAGSSVGDNPVRSGTSASGVTTRGSGVSSGSGGSTSTTPGGSGSGSTVSIGTLKIKLSLSQLNIVENSTGLISAEVTGGSGSYEMTWFKNGVALDSNKSFDSGLIISGSQIEINVGNYISSSNEGSYSLKVKDKNTTVTSQSVVVKMVPLNKSCASQNYYTFYSYNQGSAADYQVLGSTSGYADVPITTLFNNSNGNYLLPQNFNHLETSSSTNGGNYASEGYAPFLNNLISIFNSYGKNAPIYFQKISIGSATNGGRRSIACSFNLFLPTLYNKTLNPSVNWSDAQLRNCINPLGSSFLCGYNFFNRSERTYTLKGSMDLECQGGKFKIIKNNCELIAIENENSTE